MLLLLETAGDLQGWGAVALQRGATKCFQLLSIMCSSPRRDPRGVTPRGRESRHVKSQGRCSPSHLALPPQQPSAPASPTFRFLELARLFLLNTDNKRSLREVLECSCNTRCLPFYGSDCSPRFRAWNGQQ